MDPRIRYAIFHWCATLLLGPLLLVAGNAVFLDGGQLRDAGLIITLCLVYGLLLSMPTLVLYTAVLFWLAKGRLTGWMLTTVLNTTAIAGIGITLYLLGGTLMPALFWSYAAAVVVTSLPLRL